MMNPQNPTPSSAADRSGRWPAAQRGDRLAVSERQTKAYLLARDALRRIQRCSLLVDSALRQVGTGASCTLEARRQNH